MINKMVQKYLKRKGYIAVEKSTIDYAISVMDDTIRDIDINSVKNTNKLKNILAAKYRLTYYRLD